ncbi:MAG: ABC transporter permease subunit, partial [Steroidobacteraceae bacterium]
IFRPLVAWGDRFRIDQELGVTVPSSWALNTLQRSHLIGGLRVLFNSVVRWSIRRRRAPETPQAPSAPRRARRGDLIWFAGLIVVVALAVWFIARILISETSLHEALGVAGLGFLTMLRVVVLIALASVVWVPIGIWIGLRPRAAAVAQPIAQFLAAFPANLLYPLVFFGIVTWKLNPDIWLSPLMILGTQWYILFNVIAGAAAMPAELRDASQSLGVGGRLWWRRVALPSILPYYVTGAITASGGAWNASVLAEVLTWRNTHIEAHGLGAYITEASNAANFHRVILGITMMSLFVVALNRVFWRPLYYYAERKFRLT